MFVSVVVILIIERGFLHAFHNSKQVYLTCLDTLLFSNAFVFGKDGIIKALAIKNMSPLVRVTYFLQIALITFK